VKPVGVTRTLRSNNICTHRQCSESRERCYYTGLVRLVAATVIRTSRGKFQRLERKLLENHMCTLGADWLPAFGPSTPMGYNVRVIGCLLQGWMQPPAMQKAAAGLSLPVRDFSPFAGCGGAKACARESRIAMARVHGKIGITAPVRAIKLLPLPHKSSPSLLSHSLLSHFCSSLTGKHSSILSQFFPQIHLC
jgi:hypothetical protein